MSSSGKEQRTGTQSIERALHVMRIVASRSRTGVRLTEISRLARLEQSTTHRILKCLISGGMIQHNADSRRYHLGHLIFEMGLAAAGKFNVRAICRPSLVRLAEKTEDTIFLTIRSGFDTVCLDRKEGGFPIRTLTLDIGTRRPLGVGAGGIALLMSLPETEIDEILNANALQLGSYNNLTVPEVSALVERSRKFGFALNDRHMTPGATSIGMAIQSGYGVPFVALSIGAITSRMSADRQQELAECLREEVRILESSLAEMTHPL